MYMYLEKRPFLNGSGRFVGSMENESCGREENMKSIIQMRTNQPEPACFCW